MRLPILPACFIFVIALVTIPVTGDPQCQHGNECANDSECCTGCCIDNKCADNPKWCPCSEWQSPCDKETQVCVPHKVQCVMAPCYPLHNCLPRVKLYRDKSKYH
ncbi:uncharacterized protein LOC131671690 [Phymastichus coffea]|uniref:uncharacterized protein LOC131671690 n=1 Tax=Phymastichus coffea TaxID=108790 RepID=UPI00273BFDDF|nr:uncharacterized protein LOC131671690 [Phymastichus coffea]